MRLFVVVLFIISSCTLTAQERPFAKEIEAFKAEDARQEPPKNAIVFVGSSSFRMWKDIQQDFPDHKIINRGFGGSSLPHVIDYADKIVIPYQPKKIVIYCGDNDFTKDDVTSEIVTKRFVTLFNNLRSALPRAEIIYVSIKPSPSRQHLHTKMAAANDAIRDFLKTKRRTAFVNIWDDMLDANGSPRRDLYLKDMLHMNDKGYDIWQKEIAPHLK